MKIAVLGTGMVGRTIGGRLVGLGYQVMMGSRTADNEKATAWKAEHGAMASHGTFSNAAAFGEIIFNCTKGMHTLEILELAGRQNLSGKILVDVTNPLDFTKGFPPTLTVCNDNSLGEQIQTAFPEIRVVKTLNTMTCSLMVDPNLIHKGEHHVFMCGNDDSAKKDVSKILMEFGWKTDNILDLGDITNSRGTEMFLPLWVRLMPVVGSTVFQIQLVK
ncbi:MAG: NAD(P)-binding domain-containing protein [Bacteroidetes bacterium]|nr:NAD(P)-binding domain-containing protein [Bacteroidota bacterium]